MNAKLSFIEKHEVVAEDIFLNIGNGLIDIELNEKKRTQQQLALFNHLKSLLQFDNIDDENKNLDALNLLSSDQIQSLSIFFTQKIFHSLKKIKKQECDISELRSLILKLDNIDDENKSLDALNLLDEDKSLNALNLLSSDLSIFFTQKIFHLNKKIKEQECDIFELRSRIHQLEKIFEKHTTF